MAHLDVFALGPKQLVLDVQTDLLRPIDTRIVVPLLELEQAPAPIPRLNPILLVDELPVLMLTQALSAVPERSLKGAVCSLRSCQSDVTAALDMVFQGF